MALLLALNRSQGMTLLVSLHRVALAQRRCQRALALRDGVLVYDGPLNELSPAFLRSLYGGAADELLGGDAHAAATDHRQALAPASLTSLAAAA